MVHVKFINRENNTESNILKQVKKNISEGKHNNLLTMLSSTNIYYSMIHNNYRLP
jgi:hypothetical protein